MKTLMECAPGCDYPIVGYHAHRGGKVLCKLRTCGATSETAHLTGKLGHSQHVCRRGDSHAKHEHRCSTCSDTFSTSDPADTAQPEPELHPTDDRLYFVYRADSALPLLAGWRDREAALRYAKDSNASVVLGVDVAYRANPPFEEM